MLKKLNKFEFILIAAQRTRNLNSGTSAKINNSFLHKDTVLAIKELHLRLFSIDKIKKIIFLKLSTYIDKKNNIIPIVHEAK